MFRKTLKSQAISMHIFPENISVSASHEQTVLEALLKQDIEVHHSCGGMGTCGTCAVEVIEGYEKLEALTEQEVEISKDRTWKPQQRLSCQIHARDGLVLKKNYST